MCADVRRRTRTARHRRRDPLRRRRGRHRRHVHRRQRRRAHRPRRVGPRRRPSPTRRRGDDPPDRGRRPVELRRGRHRSTTDGAGRVRAFVEKPAPGTEPSNLISAGTYVLEPSVLDLMRPGCGPRSSVTCSRSSSPAAGCTASPPRTTGSMPAGPSSTWRRTSTCSSGVRRFDHCEAIDDTADVDASAMVRHSMVGAGARIGANAR